MYDNLDRERCLNVLVDHDMVPQVLLLLRTYWKLPTMVVKADGFNASPLKGSRVVTQGDPLYPIISNMVIDAVLRQWIMAVVEEETGPDSFVCVVRSLEVLFYTNDGLLVSTRAERLQRYFHALIDLFDRVGMWMNIQR